VLQIIFAKESAKVLGSIPTMGKQNHTVVVIVSSQLVIVMVGGQMVVVMVRNLIAGQAPKVVRHVCRRMAAIAEMKLSGAAAFGHMVVASEMG